MRKASSTHVRNERWLLEQCPFSVTLSAVGNRWGAAVLWKVLGGEVRFGDLIRALPLATEKVIAQELERLQSLGLLDKVVRSEKPLRVEYELTERGRSLEPVLQCMQAWGEEQRRQAGPDGELPEVALLDRSTS